MVKKIQKPSQTFFQCPCGGENSNCVHCNGSGRTGRQVQMRSHRTLSLDHASPEPFRSKRERLFDLQVSRKLPHLREEFFKGRSEDPTVFVDFLNELIMAVDRHFSLQRFLPDFFKQMGLGSSVKNFRAICHLRISDEDAGILAKATDAMIAVYEKALFEKRQIAKVQQQSIRSAIDSRSKVLIQCPNCNSKTYDQDQHNQLFHPALRAGLPRQKKPKQVVLRPPTPKPTLRQKGLRSKTANGQPSPPNILSKARPKDRVDTGPVENRLDAHRTWGGRFRDTNGTFGSYPVHDSMDDESNAG